MGITEHDMVLTFAFFTYKVLFSIPSYSVGAGAEGSLLFTKHFPSFFTNEWRPDGAPIIMYYEFSDFNICA